MEVEQVVLAGLEVVAPVEIVLLPLPLEQMEPQILEVVVVVVEQPQEIQPLM